MPRSGTVAFLHHVLLSMEYEEIPYPPSFRSSHFISWHFIPSLSPKWSFTIMYHGHPSTNVLGTMSRLAPVTDLRPFGTLEE